MENSNFLFSVLNLKEKIKIEKRKRYQTYSALNYLISSISYFDFFSKDTFKIAKKSKYLSQLFARTEITSEFLILPFLEINSEIAELLKTHSINFQNVEELIVLLNKKKVEKANFFENFGQKIFKKEVHFQKNLVYSYEINQIFEKASENALNRFKTPIITPEILFLTILEEKTSRGGKLLKKLLKTETEWFLIRYKLLKKLHNQEVQIRNEVSKNQQYFGYLFKSQLSDKEFEKLLDKKLLEESVSTFRNFLVFETIEKNIFEILENDVKRSILTTNNRKYSN
jgi:hypothetical protein